MRSRVGIATLALVVGAGTLAACEPTLYQESGIVIEVDSPALGRVDSFLLLTPESEMLTFDTSELRFRPEFPASHLNEHKVLGDTIVVTFRQDGERRVATQLDDASH